MGLGSFCSKNSDLAQLLSSSLLSVLYSIASSLKGMPLSPFHLFSTSVSLLLQTSNQMRQQVWLTALIAGFSTLSGVFAGRMGDVSRRKGYAPEAMAGNVEMQKLEGRTKEHYRFLNKNTTSQYTFNILSSYWSRC